MFSEITGSYDLMNWIMSLGFDGLWRKSAGKESLIEKKIYSVMDIAAGTGDFSIAINKACIKEGKKVVITGIDFNNKMLEIARRKTKHLGVKINFETGDALALQFPDRSFDVVASAFGLRNFDSLEKFVGEANRVLKKGGKLVLLDMAAPDNGLMKYAFRFYFKIILLEGALVNRKAYSYLVSSINEFDKNRLPRLLSKSGFSEIKITELPTRVAFMVTARKP